MRMTERNSENRKIFDVANARRVRLALLARIRTPDRSITGHTMSNLSNISVDIVSGIVYNAHYQLAPQQGRQVFYPNQTRRKAMLITDMPYNVNKLIKSLTQECVKMVSGTQTRLRKSIFTRISYARVRKGILNSFIMRKSTRLKENKYGENLNVR